MRDDLSALDTALALLRRDLWPVALHPGQKRPIDDGWGRSRPTEAAPSTLYSEHPDAGVGIVLGPEAGVIDIEIDGSEGEASLRRLCGGEAPPTLSWSSRRGPHRLYGWHDRLSTLPGGSGVIKCPALPGLEIRFGGARKQFQSACPPTLTDGHARRWDACEDIAPLPEAALRFLADALAESRSGPDGASAAAPPRPSPAAPAAVWFRKALKNEAGRVATAREGGRHDTLLASARTLGGYIHHGYLTEADVISELTHAARRAGLPDPEIAATIRDGLANGKAAPLPWPDKLDRLAGVNGRVSGGSPHAAAPRPGDWPAAPAPIRAELPPVPKLPPDQIPEPLRAWLCDIADRMSCPLEFPAVGALVALAVLVGRRVSIRPKRFDDWSVVPNLWGAVIGRPGLLKTPALTEAIRPLRRLEAEARERHAPDLAQYETEGMLANARAAAAKDKLKAAARSINPMPSRRPWRGMRRQPRPPPRS